MNNQQTHPDLFGGETPIQERTGSPIQERKRQLRYHKAKIDEPACRDCNHLIEKGFHGRTYYKCELIGDSNSSATDVRLSATCNQNTELVS